MTQVSTVGLDLAKYIFQLHGPDSAGAVVFRKKLRRGQLLAFLATLPPCSVAMEACASAHSWGREITKLGHKHEVAMPYVPGAKFPYGRQLPEWFEPGTVGCHEAFISPRPSASWSSSTW